MGRRSQLVEEHTSRVGRANKSEFKVACNYCRKNGEETHFVSRTDAVLRHLKVCKYYDGDLPTMVLQPRSSHPELAASMAPLGSMAPSTGQGSTSMASSMAPEVGNEPSGPRSYIPAKRAFDTTSPSTNNKLTPAWITNFERKLLRAFVSTGTSFNAIDDKCFRELLESISPQLGTYPHLVPSKADLNRILHETDQSLKREITKDLAICKRLTLTVDTWMNSADRYTLAYVLQTPSFKSYAWEWNDVTFERHSNKNIAHVVNKNPDLADKVVGVVVTRAAAKHISEEANIRQNLAHRLLLLSCYDQELTYMVGDCLSSQQGIKDTINLANRIVQFFQDKQRLSVLHEFLAERNMAQQEFQGAINTEWITANLSLKLLITAQEQVRQALDFISGAAQLDSHTRQVAQELRNGADSGSSFWLALEGVHELIAAMAEYQALADAEHGARLRMVLPAAYRIWTALDRSLLDNVEQIKAMMNQRIATWDVDLLVTATVLDPSIRRTLFNDNVVSTKMLMDNCRDLYKRFFPASAAQPEAIGDLTVSFSKYLSGNEWPFNDQSVSGRSLLSFYWPSLIKHDHSRLADLGVRLESCVVSPVDTDQLFSDMGYIHSALRSTKTVVVGDRGDRDGSGGGDRGDREDGVTDPTHTDHDGSSGRGGKRINNGDESAIYVEGEMSSGRDHDRVKDQRDLCALLDICLLESTFNSITSSVKHIRQTGPEMKFETLFEGASHGPSHVTNLDAPLVEYQ